MTRRAWWVPLELACLVVACVMGFPAGADAQGAFTGVVKDTSGSVLPGVTVEAASPVLIEKVKTATTAGQGQYRIVDLRPGTYTLSFTLPGFRSVKLEGIELRADFTACDRHAPVARPLSTTPCISQPTSSCVNGGRMRRSAGRSSSCCRTDGTHRA
ncbi:MAG: carboxypeptidase regulatory-like domain-containing protein [Acidobacteria bacterium]|nr:carboxypeptidase regulatory-like domain-containing protein [Acidobacteriota bacterium]